MRSIKTTVTAAAVLTAGFILAAPAAHAATAPVAASAPQVHSSDDCGAAIHAAQMAKHDFFAAAADLKKEVAAGGHPDASEESNLAELKDAAESAIKDARQACEGDEHRHRHSHHPHGAMHTGVGSMSQGTNGGEIAGGLGILGAAGFGALALRRRRAGSES